MGKKIYFKDAILNRYTDEYQKATIDTVNIRKSSQDILLDLRPLADLTTNEISEYLVSKGYEIDFEGDKPVWLLNQRTLELSKIDNWWEKE